MASLRQIVAVIAMSLLGIRHRVGPCLVIVLGIAGAVGVLISVFAMAEGFSAMATRTGRAERAIVLAKGAETEASSSLSREEVAVVLGAGSIRTDAQGRSIASADSLAFLRLTDEHTGLDAFATVRGVSQQVLSLRPEVRLVEGRMFEPGLNELIVGRTLQRRLAGLDVGSHLSLPQGEWTIVGVFASDADLRESELLADAESLLSAYRRNVFNSVTVALQSSTRFDSFRDALARDPALSVRVERERDYLAAASAGTSKVLSFIASFIGGVMALGAAFAAMNAMYSAISTRSLEIATLRALGYGATPVVISVLFEAMAWALVGATIGAGAAWQILCGNAVSTLSSASPAPVTFVLDVGPGLVAIGIACACTIGLFGGLFPAIRVARLSVASALKRT